MAAHDSALSELSEMLVASDAKLATALSEIVTVAIQELIEAELTVKIGAEPGAHPGQAGSAERASTETGVDTGR